MPSTRKFRLVIAYDGAPFAGWQVQKTGVGVQEKIEDALKKLFPGAGRVHSSSRTDTGVHALGMVVHFEIPAEQFKMRPAKLALAINAFLPPEVRVMKAAPVPEKFHARFDATGKEYRYQVWNAPAMNPLLRHMAWHVPTRLNRDAMKKAAAVFPGRHDFKSFAGNRNYEMETTVRTLHRCQLLARGPLLTFVLVGDGFLYKMCRNIVGTLIQVGQGKFEPGEIKRLLEQRDRSVSGMTAPAHGLVLWKVHYRKGAG